MKFDNPKSEKKKNIFFVEVEGVCVCVGGGGGGGGRGGTETKTVSQTVKTGIIQNSNHLHDVKHVVQSTFQNT